MNSALTGQKYKCKLYYGTTTDDYRKAPGGDGNSILVLNWNDKPHRLIYDLCNEVDRLRAILDAHEIPYETVLEEK